jgi:hypothetical protein
LELSLPEETAGADGAGSTWRMSSPSLSSPTDPLAPYDLSQVCDGRRTDFPLGMLVETVKVMLNNVYLAEGLDFLLAHKNGQSKVELRRPPRPGDTLVVLRVPARESAIRRPTSAHPGPDDVPAYEALPRIVKDNISREQSPEALREVVHVGVAVPETARYVNLKNGLIHPYQIGERADGPLLPVFALAGGRGKDDTQFHTSPSGARSP